MTDACNNPAPTTAQPRAEGHLLGRIPLGTLRVPRAVGSPPRASSIVHGLARPHPYGGRMTQPRPGLDRVSELGLEDVEFVVLPPREPPPLPEWARKQGMGSRSRVVHGGAWITGETVTISVTCWSR